MINRILIPMDVSETSLAAAEYGCALAARLGAQVTLLNVFSAGIVATPDGVFASTAEELSAVSGAAQAHLRSVAEKVARAGLSVESVAVEGLAGAHGRRGVSRLLLGSVAEHTLRHAPCPVLPVGRACAQAGHAVDL